MNIYGMMHIVSHILEPTPPCPSGDAALPSLSNTNDSHLNAHKSAGQISSQVLRLLLMLVGGSLAIPSPSVPLPSAEC